MWKRRASPSIVRPLVTGNKDEEGTPELEPDDEVDEDDDNDEAVGVDTNDVSCVSTAGGASVAIDTMVSMTVYSATLPVSRERIAPTRAATLTARPCTSRRRYEPLTSTPPL